MSSFSCHLSMANKFFLHYFRYIEEGLVKNMSATTSGGSSGEAMQLLSEISSILRTGLTEEQLAISIRLIETGVNPNALANVIRILRRESAAINNEQGGGDPSQHRL